VGILQESDYPLGILRPLPTQVFEVAAATVLAVRGAETRYGNVTRGGPIELAFVGDGTGDFRHRNIGRGEQIVDVPAQGFFPAQVAGDAGLEVALRRAGVDVMAGGKVELTQAAHGDAQRLGHMDAELIGAEALCIHGAASEALVHHGRVVGQRFGR
jgi:hypothetical protein